MKYIVRLSNKPKQVGSLAYGLDRIPFTYVYTYENNNLLIILELILKSILDEAHRRIANQTQAN